METLRWTAPPTPTRAPSRRRSRKDERSADAPITGDQRSTRRVLHGFRHGESCGWGFVRRRSGRDARDRWRVRLRQERERSVDNGPPPQARWEDTRRSGALQRRRPAHLFEQPDAAHQGQRDRHGVPGTHDLAQPPPDHRPPADRVPGAPHGDGRRAGQNKSDRAHGYGGDHTTPRAGSASTRTT